MKKNNKYAFDKINVPKAKVTKTLGIYFAHL